MLNEKEQEIFDEIEKWQKSKFKTGVLSAVVNTVFSPIEYLVDLVLPNKVVEKAVKPMTVLLKKLQKTSLNFVNIDSIVKKASNAGLVIKDLDGLRSISIEYLDVLTKSFFGKNVIFSALQGAGLGAGSYALIVADLPLLVNLNMKTIFQIGACYGYNPESVQEREFALHIFCIALSLGSEQDIELKKMDALIVDGAKGTFSYELGILASDESLNAFATKFTKRFLKRKVSHGIPIISIVLGGGFNYLYTKETAIFAYMLYRKRFLFSKV